MSQENVEVVRRAYDEVNTRLEPSEEIFHPDYEVDATDTGADVGITRGAGAAREAFLEYWETFENFHVDIQEVIHADPERVVTLVRDGGRMKGSDAEVWNRFFHVWTFAGGKVIRLSIHTDRSRALEAAGLSGYARGHAATSITGRGSPSGLSAEGWRPWHWRPGRVRRSGHRGRLPA